MVYAESTACGLPCVASNEGGVPEAVEHGVTGMLIDPTDNEQVVSNVVALLKDPEPAAAIGEAAHRSCVQRFSWAGGARTIEGYVHTALGQVSGHRGSS